MTVNRVILVGNLGQDPEKRAMPNGDSVANVSIATTEKWTKDGEKHSKTEWHRLIFYSKLADLAAQYLNKGSQIYIEGKLQTREWQDKDGVKKYTTEIIVQQMSFLGGGKKEGNQQNQQYQKPPAQQPHTAAPAQTQQAPPQQQVPNNDIMEDD